MWINSPLGTWEMKERTRKMHGSEELGRWRREIEDARRAQCSTRPAAGRRRFELRLGEWLGLSTRGLGI